MTTYSSLNFTKSVYAESRTPLSSLYNAPHPYSWLGRGHPSPPLSPSSASSFPLGPRHCGVRRAHQMVNPALEIHVGYLDDELYFRLLYFKCINFNLNKCCVGSQVNADTSLGPGLFWDDELYKYILPRPTSSKDSFKTTPVFRKLLHFCWKWRRELLHVIT